MCSEECSFELSSSSTIVLLWLKICRATEEVMVAGEYCGSWKGGGVWEAGVKLFSVVNGVVFSIVRGNSSTLTSLMSIYGIVFLLDISADCSRLPMALSIEDIG
jgi:hypothetical protein